MGADDLAEEFELRRRRLRGVAYRLLGSDADADDAVQEAWLRLSRTDRSEIDNLGGWLTTVVSRVCLDVLRRRSTRGEVLAADGPTADQVDDRLGPDEEFILADAVGAALLVVLDSLTPTERIAFVLHDVFGLSFDEIARIVDRTPSTTRQLASRARRRVQGSTVPDRDLVREREVVESFLAAARSGDLEALVAALDPDVEFRSDAAAVRAGGPMLLTGAARVAAQFVGKAQAARPALLDGALGVVVAPAGRLLVTLELVIVDDRILQINAVADPGRLEAMHIDDLER